MSINPYKMFREFWTYLDCRFGAGLLSYQQRATVRKEQQKELLRQAPVMSFANAVSASIVAIAFWPFGNHFLLSLWAAIIFAGSFLNLLRWYRLRKTPVPEKVSGQSLRRASRVAFVLGSLWGIAYPLFAQAVDLPYQFFIILVIGGLMAGATTNLTPLPRLSASFIYATMAPMTIALLVGPTQLHVLTGVMVFVYGVALTHIMLNGYKRFVDLIVARSEAQSASEAKSQFLALMSHELRTPLNSIIGYAELLLSITGGQQAKDRVQDYVATIHQSGTHLLNIINDILDLSRIEAGKYELKQDYFSLQDVTGRIYDMVQSQAENNGLTITISEDFPDADLLADEKVYRQIVLNLLSNAIKFTPEGGKVTISANDDKNEGLTLMVRDTGQGIAPEDMERVFEPFRQVENQLNRKREGSGLGIPLVKRMMQMHDGQFFLESKLGVGTTALVVFPPERVSSGQRGTI